MAMHRILVLGLGSMVGLATGLPATVHADQADGGGAIEEIVVVGEKKKRSLADTTSSLSVISSATLDSIQHKNLTDAVSDIPNIVTPSGAVPDIRGVSGNGAAGGFNSISGGAKGRVSILTDGVAEPFVADLTGDAGTWDVEQVEVYRGPQSTSNGRNSIAGSVYVKTRDPVFDWEGAVRVGYRTAESYVDTSAMLSGPIIDNTLAFRLSAQLLNAETITDEQGFATNPADYDLNGIDAEHLRAKLLWTPSDRFSALLTWSPNRERGDIGRIFYSAAEPSAHQRIFFRDIDSESDTTSLKLEYAFNALLSVDVLLAFMDYQWGFDSYEPTPAAEQQLAFDENNLTLDAKINFASSDRRLSGFVGLYYFDREHDVISEGAYVYSGDDASDSAGIYGELSYAFNDRWSLTAGGRVERESQTRNFVYGAINALLDEEKTITLPKLVLRHDINDRTAISVSARRGYNAAGGALNFTAQEYYYFEAETVNTYEASLRSQLAGGAIGLVANVFYNDYDGYQALSSTRFIVNMDQVVTYGAEFEVSARPVAALDVRAGLGLLRTDIKDAGAGYPDANGNRLNSAPAVTANLGLRYRLSESFGVGISAKYISEYYGDFLNTAERTAGDYTLVRLNADYAIGDWKISAFVNNAFDEAGLVTQDPPSRAYPTGYVSVVDPRNVGLSVTYSF